MIVRSMLCVTVALLVLSLTSCKTKYIPGSGPDPYEYIQILKEGTVVVFLHSYRDELQTLQTLIDSESLDAKKKDAVLEKYNTTLERRDTYITEIMNSFGSDYHFSDFLFSLDYELTEIKDGSIIVTELLPDRSTRKMKIPDNVLFLKYTQRSNNDSSHDYSWNFLTIDGEQVAQPFPEYYEYVLPAFKEIFRSIVGKNKISYQTNIGKDLNEDLSKFYAKHIK